MVLKKNIILSQYRPAIRLYKWVVTLKRMGHNVSILYTTNPIKNINFSEFNLLKYNPNYNYNEFDLHLSFNTNVKGLSHLNVKTIQCVGDLKGYYPNNIKIEKKSIDISEKLVFVSNSQKKESIKIHGEYNKESHVIINGIVDELIPKSYLPKIDNGYINIVYSGTLSGDKSNHRYFYDLFKKLSECENVKLHLYPSLTGLPDIYKTLKNVLIHESVSPYDLIKELSQYDIGLIYLNNNNKGILNSTMPNKLFEYLQAGLPIISGEYSEIVKFNEGKNCISFFNNESDLQDSIKSSIQIDGKKQRDYVVNYSDQIHEINKIIK